MNLKNFYKYRLIIILVIVVVFLGMTKLRYKNVKWEELEPVPTVVPSPTRAPQINNNYPLWEFIPYSGDGFKIDHYTEPLVLTIKIDDEVDEEMVMEEIYNWMRENKVATESHKLIFEKE
jgi:hypothetical protein